jgi:hypothetical protein
MKKRDQARQDWNKAADIFYRIYPHFPKAAPTKPQIRHRDWVIEAILAGIKAGRES